jgi:hypothetical protein
MFIAFFMPGEERSLSVEIFNEFLSWCSFLKILQDKMS